MSESIDEHDLKAGDVLLYHGTSFVSQMIRLFDGSDYNHASICDGSGVAEAVDRGVIHDAIAASTADAKFVDVFRFRSNAGNGLDDSGYGAQPVVDRINYYLAQHERYAYEEIVLLAFLAATRRLPVASWIPGLGRILRTILDNAVDIINAMIAEGKEPMICSEFVYRCYVEAGDKYAIGIVGADRLMKFSIHDSLSQGLMPLAGAEEQDQEAQELAASAQEFLHLFAAARKTTNRLLAVADFVTPRDIATSPNLIRIGRLKH